MDVVAGAAGRLARLEAAELARTTLVSYIDATDAKDLGAMSRVFADDAIMRVDDTVLTGKAAILDYFQAVFSSSAGRKAHFVTNVQVVSAGPEEVRLASYFLYLDTSGAPRLDGWGMYRDTVRVSEGQAVIAGKQMTGSWNGHAGPNGHLSWTESGL
jgi:ketosteroid isomerase-like protein